MNHLQLHLFYVFYGRLCLNSAVRQRWTESGTTGSQYPELVLAVLWPLVERPVIVEAADIVYAVEALDPLGHTLQLRHIRDV